MLAIGKMGKNYFFNLLRINVFLHLCMYFALLCVALEVERGIRSLGITEGCKIWASTRATSFPPAAPPPPSSTEFLCVDLAAS